MAEDGYLADQAADREADFQRKYVNKWDGLVHINGKKYDS